MNAGKLRHRVTFQQRPAGADAYGQQSGDWKAVTALTDLACEVLDLDGRELIQAQAISADVTVRITMRGFTGWRQQIRPDMRALARGRTFDVKSITNPDGRDRQLVVLAKELVRGG